MEHTMFKGNRSCRAGGKNGSLFLRNQAGDKTMGFGVGGGGEEGSAKVFINGL